MPAGVVGAAGGQLNVLPLAANTVPAPPNGFQISPTIFLITLTDSASGTQLAQLTNPIDLQLQLAQSDLDAVGGDLSRLKLSALVNNTWVALNCSASGSTLDCSVPHLSLFGLVTAPPATPPLDSALPNGHFFKQANGFNGAGDAGFSVTDDGDASFWSEFQRLGGADRLGFPISQRFTFNNLPTQVFQRTALQWHADLGQAVPLDLFPALTARGNDAWLDQARQIPPPADSSPDAGLAPDQVAARHMSMLDAYPALHDFYAADPLAPTLFGLPLSVKDYGQFVTVRFARASVRLWTASMPWAAAGSISVDSDADLAKSLGVWPDAALMPAALPSTNATSDGSGGVTDATAPAASDASPPADADAPTAADAATAADGPGDTDTPAAADPSAAATDAAVSSDAPAASDAAAVTSDTGGSDATAGTDARAGTHAALATSGAPSSGLQGQAPDDNESTSLPASDAGQGQAPDDNQSASLPASDAGQGQAPDDNQSASLPASDAGQGQ